MSASADRFVVDPAHPSLPGHFPGQPVVPGVVVLDRVLAAIEAAHGPLGAVRLPQVKFVQPLLPGQPARVELEPATAGDAAPRRWKFRVLREEAVIATGEVQAAERAP